MLNLRALAAAAAVSVTSLCLASSAAASTEVGSNCLGAAALPAYTLVPLAADPASSPLPITAPAAGVVTQWKVNVIPFSGSLPEKLKVFRSTSDPDQFQTVAQSDMGTVVGGVNTFNTRVPVAAGDRFGVNGGTETVYCPGLGAASSMGTVAGDPAIGSTATFTPTAAELPAVSAVIEPDADGDGYGDETQDKCPVSKSFQIPCPVITLDSAAFAGKGSASVLVTSDFSASVSVSGSVALPKAKTPKKRLARGGTLALKGSTSTVAPGQLGRFSLAFPSKLKTALKTLPRSKSLTLTIAESAPNVAVGPTVKSLTVKLPGQAPKK